MKRKMFEQNYFPDGFDKRCAFRMKFQVLNSKRMKNLNEEEIHYVVKMISDFIADLKETKNELIDHYKTNLNKN